MKQSDHSFDATSSAGHRLIERRCWEIREVAGKLRSEKECIPSKVSGTGRCVLAHLYRSIHSKDHISKIILIQTGHSFDATSSAWHRLIERRCWEIIILMQMSYSFDATSSAWHRLIERRCWEIGDI